MDVHIPDEKYLQYINVQKQNLENAKLRKGERPTDRVPKDAAYASFMWALMAQKYQESQMEYAMRTTLIPPSYLPCTKAMASLKQMNIKDLQLETHHRGKYLLLRTITPPRRMTAIMALMEDERDDVVLISLYHQEGEKERPAAEVINTGTILLVKEPYFKVYSNGGYGLRVDHLSDVLRIDEDDDRVPYKWQPRFMEMNRPAEALKKEGNAAVGRKKYWEAIAKYTKALHLRATADELVIIKRNRALAYLNTEQYDAALSDTGFPDWESVDFNEKALFRAAEALYKLGRFSESVETMRSLRSHYPNNERAKEMLFRTKYRFQEQETGIYDFKKLQREAKQLRPPHLDHATYVGPIEVRQTESKGRGLFVTKAVKAGELLLCEKAFCHAFADENGMTGSTTTLLMNIETGKGFVGAQANLITSIVHKLHRNPSIAHKFTELFHGDYKSAATLSHEAKGIVDTFLVDRTMSLNVFGCPLSSLLYHKEAISSRNSLKKYEDHKHSSCGIWTLASYINHGCVSNVYRAFIGDMMIVRATRDLPPGTELAFWYHMGDAKDLQEKLRGWGFTCDCPICTDERGTRVRTLTERRKLFDYIEELFNSSRGNATALQKERVAKLLRQLNGTYVRPPNEVPRLRLGRLEFILSEAYIARAMWRACVDWIRKGLASLGFVVSAPATFEITEWGVVNDQLVGVFLCARNAFKKLGENANSERAHGYARMAYRMIIGEDETFDELYG